MPWELEIHIIDVGQGESSFIIARDPVTSESRTMLIDGGEVGYADTVHNYIIDRLKQLNVPTKVDHILVSHYDKDHSGGILSLLIADNLDQLCWLLAAAAGHAAEAAMNAGQDTQHRIAAAAAATAFGAYDAGKKADFAGAAAAAAIDSYNLSFSLNNNDPAHEGAETGKEFAARAKRLNEALLPKNGQRWRSAAVAAGNAAGAGNFGDWEQRALPAATAVFAMLRAAVPEASRFRTNGMYSDVHIIDTGNNAEPEGYIEEINGQMLLDADLRAKLPNTNRLRSGHPPTLGEEVLWNSGHLAAPAPDESPAIFVVSAKKKVWKSSDVPGLKKSNNNDSIGLILRFNEFFYYTGGDLASNGEERIANAIMRNGLPKPAGGFFPKPGRIACFKCGHHGSSHSTSTTFLNTTRAKAAFISNGGGQFKDETHPAQATIDRLHNNKHIDYFYLTTCYHPRTHVPASQQGLFDQQLTTPGNKSRVCGDNNPANLGDFRVARGSVWIWINQIVSAFKPAGAFQRVFNVNYYEKSDRSHRVEIVEF